MLEMTLAPKKEVSNSWQDKVVGVEGLRVRWRGESWFQKDRSTAPGNWRAKDERRIREKKKGSAGCVSSISTLPVLKPL